MLKHTKLLGVGPFLAVLVLLFPLQGWSATLAKGVEFQVVKEFPVDMPGVQTMRLTKVTIEPGAKLANYTVKDPIFCSGTKGVVSVVDHTFGTTKVYAAGSHWAVRKGARVSFFNPGDVTHEHYFYSMVGLEQEVGLRATPQGTKYLAPGAFP